MAGQFNRHTLASGAQTRDRLGKTLLSVIPREDRPRRKRISHLSGKLPQIEAETRCRAATT